MHFICIPSIIPPRIYAVSYPLRVIHEPLHELLICKAVNMFPWLFKLNVN